MANLENYKQVKIRTDDMISQQFTGFKNLSYVYLYLKFLKSQFFTDTIRNITDSTGFCLCWKY